MNRTRVLIKTTIAYREDDWHVGRFSMLADQIAALVDEEGHSLFDVTSLDRRVDTRGDDIDLADAAAGSCEQLWLFAVDAVDALTDRDAQCVTEFRARGGGCVLTRDHQDLGASLTRLGALGQTQHFRTTNPEPRADHRQRDDRETRTIDWPDYHTGRNGDAQRVEATLPLHPVMRRAFGEAIAFLPAHPHEGVVGVPPPLADVARVVAGGRSADTGVVFDLAVAVDEPGQGRAFADASFHRFCDYNRDPRSGAPTFVDEPAGDGLLRDPVARQDAWRYAENIAFWLARRA